MQGPVKLDPEISSLLLNKAPFEVIEDAWNGLYGDWTCQNNRNHHMCANVLTCFAVFYSHTEIFYSLFILNNPFCIYSPWITAIQMNNPHVISCVMMESSTDGLHVTYTDQIKRKGSYINEKCHGVITNLQLGVTEEVSALDIILQRDDSKALKMLLDKVYRGVVQALVKMASEYGAKRCMALITRRIARSYEDEDVLKNIIEYSSCHHGLTTPLQYISAVYQLKSLTHNFTTPTSFLTTADKHVLKQCMKGPVQQQLEYGKQASHTGGLHHRVVLENCMQLLNKVQKSNSTGPVVPANVFLTLMDKIQAIWDNIKRVPASEVAALRSSMVLLNDIMKLFFQTGIQEMKCQKRNLCNRRDDMIKFHGGKRLPCSCSKYNPYYIVNKVFYGVSPAVAGKAATNPRNSHLELLNLVHENFMMLLAYGYVKQTVHCLIKIDMCSSSLLKNANQVSVSLMQHSSFEYYRSYRKSLQAMVSEKGNDSTYSHWSLRLYKMALRCSYMGNVRSLKELCRVKMYALVPTGKMPEYVQQLEISAEQKLYLSLGVKPLQLKS